LFRRRDLCRVDEELEDDEAGNSVPWAMCERWGPIDDEDDALRGACGTGADAAALVGFAGKGSAGGSSAILSEEEPSLVVTVLK